MAKSLLNSGLEEMRGTIDQWVYKVVRGRRIIARRPKINPNRTPTPSEVEARARFANAANYAKGVLSDAARRVPYEAVAKERNLPVFALVLQDFYSEPLVHEIRTTGYTGKVGDKIVVRASDPSGANIASVRVAIKHNVTHAVLESGAAVPTGAEWTYTATTALPANTAVTIEATAVDGPGNATMESKVYP